MFTPHLCAERGTERPHLRSRCWYGRLISRRSSGLSTGHLMVPYDQMLFSLYYHLDLYFCQVEHFHLKHLNVVLA